MGFFMDIWSYPSTWLVVLGIIAIYLTAKVIKNMIGIVLSIVFTIISVYRVYLFMQNVL